MYELIETLDMWTNLEQCTPLEIESDRGVPAHAHLKQLDLLCLACEPLLGPDAGLLLLLQGSLVSCVGAHALSEVLDHRRVA